MLSKRNCGIIDITSKSPSKRANEDINHIETTKMDHSKQGNSRSIN